MDIPNITLEKWHLWRIIDLFQQKIKRLRKRVYTHVYVCAQSANEEKVGRRKEKEKEKEMDGLTKHR